MNSRNKTTIMDKERIEKEMEIVNQQARLVREELLMEKLPNYYDVFRLTRTIGAYPSVWDALISGGDGGNRVFEFLNSAFIGRLAEYLSERIESLHKELQEEIVIVEVGAGDGRLTHFLREAIIGSEAPHKMVAIDDNSWRIEHIFPVEVMSHTNALEKYKPHITIFCWMPHGYDCTQEFRDHGVEEYILIGEGAGGCCGAQWETWGEDTEWHLLDNEDYVSPTPPYIEDGYGMEYLKEISESQLCRTDYREHSSHSVTVSFRKIKGE